MSSVLGVPLGQDGPNDLGGRWFMGWRKRWLAWLALPLVLGAASPDAGSLLEARLDAIRVWPGLLPATRPGPPRGLPRGQDWVGVGRRLFSDPRLSGSGDMSCATCHQPAHGYAEARPLAVGHRGRLLARHTPTVVDTALLSAFFWDGRAATLADQALGPLLSPAEMAGTREGIARVLEEDPLYRKAFRAAFARGGKVEDAALALEAYERTLVSGPSRVDRYVAGDRKALTREEKLGLFVFTGKGSCTMCHRGPALSDGAFHALGLPPLTPGASADPGRMALTGQASDLGAFRTPPLRQVSRTPPYMHDGRFPTLEAVVEFYDRGGGPGHSPLIEPLGLSEEERRALVAFLRALDGPVRP
ncbi:MAG: cytochrome c peroxidase [Candidatus Sericytochromatia bacterium]|nr:cytochrome c peroxidase [Candidatus Sericytochromatia bacterium]